MKKGRLRIAATRGGAFAAAAVAVCLALVAATARASVDRHATSKLTVWLQVDAQTGWSDLVASTNAQFQKDHPGVTVDVQYQTWPTHLQRFDATLAGGNTPDVIEMGNSEMTKYMAAGAFQALDKGAFDNSSTWLKGLAASGQYGGKTYGVPYYAGTRVITYRTDLFQQVGAKVPPKSLADFQADAKKLGAKFASKKGFSPVYIAGKDWYVGMGFVFDYGGSIAKTSKGRWVGTLDSPQSIAGLTAFKNFFQAASRASKTVLENNPFPYDVYAQGLAASMPGPTWFTCCVGKKFTKVSSQFVMPSHVAGQVMPTFLGGSDLAVPIGADKALATDWIKDFTGTQAERKLQSVGNVPNATNLLDLKKVNEKAALRTWFVPQAKNWVNVENEQILRNMFSQILTGRLTVKQAARAASDNVTSILNAN